MAKHITGQVLGGSAKPNLEVGKVKDVAAELGIDSKGYKATVNGEPADMGDKIADFAFVSFSPQVKGGK